MIRYTGLAVLFVLFAAVSSAQTTTLTAQQLQTLKNDIVGGALNSNPDTPDGNTAIANAYNLNASPTFTVWRTNVPIGEVGKTFNATELAGLSSLNTQRLQNLAAWLSAGVNPSLTPIRAFFDDIFSGAGGTNTRAALLVIWKRPATRAEKLFATGTGSDPSPATMGFEGRITLAQVQAARQLP